MLPFNNNFAKVTQFQQIETKLPFRTIAKKSTRKYVAFKIILLHLQQQINQQN